MSLLEKPLAYKLHYVATLDPWLRRDHKDIDRLLKLGCLTSHHLVVSDNQLVNNRGLLHLLKRRDVADFLLTPDNDGAVPVVISLRQTATDFEDVLTELVINRERPAIFPWMTSEQQMKLEQACAGGKHRTLGCLFDIAGKEFADHIDALNRFLSIKRASVVTWEGLQSSYLTLVEAAIHRFVRSIKNNGQSNADGHIILSVCDSILARIAAKTEVNRSNLARLIGETPLKQEIKRTLELKVLHEPYHANFASAGGFNIMTGDEYRDGSLDTVFPDLPLELPKIQSSDITDLEMFPMYLDQIPYNRIQHIRNSESFKRLTFSMQDVLPEKRVYLIRDLLSLIHSELAREPSGLGKLGRLRIRNVFASKDFQARLAEAGMSFADVISFAGTSTGFLAGEIVGQMIGLFGVGGLAGAGAGVLVERIVDQTVIKPRQRREFQQIVQLLASEPAVAARSFGQNDGTLGGR